MGEEGNGDEDDSEVEEGEENDWEVGREDRGEKREGIRGMVRRQRARLVMSRTRVWRMLAAVGVRATVSCVTLRRRHAQAVGEA